MRYFMSQRIKILKAIRAKIRPKPVREPLPKVLRERYVTSGSQCAFLDAEETAAGERQQSVFMHWPPLLRRPGTAAAVARIRDLAIQS